MKLICLEEDKDEEVEDVDGVGREGAETTTEMEAEAEADRHSDAIARPSFLSLLSLSR